MDRLLNKGSYRRAKIPILNQSHFLPEDANGLPYPGTCTVLPDIHPDTSSILFSHSASWRDIRPDQRVKDG